MKRTLGRSTQRAKLTPQEARNADEEAESGFTPAVAAGLGLVANAKARLLLAHATRGSAPLKKEEPEFRGDESGLLRGDI